MPCFKVSDNETEQAAPARGKGKAKGKGKGKCKNVLIPGCTPQSLPKPPPLRPQGVVTPHPKAPAHPAKGAAADSKAPAGKGQGKAADGDGTGKAADGKGQGKAADGQETQNNPAGGGASSGHPPGWINMSMWTGR